MVAVSGRCINSRSAIVLLSGGLDSAVCLWWAKRRWDVYALSVNFYRRNPREVMAARSLAKAANVERISVDLPFLREIRDLDQRKAIDLPAVYIPSRNLIFYGLASYWAEARGASRLFGGHTAEDGYLFPDATERYIANLNRLLRSARRRLVIEAPLIHLRKAGVVRLALRLKVPLELTWSCHSEGSRHCGKCLGCVRRKEAFAAARVADPVAYAL